MEHHVEFLDRRHFLAIDRNRLGTLGEFHERVLQDLSVQLDKTHPHKPAGFLAAAEPDSGK